jgi:mono/diheme cytochrome c family protein
MIKKIILSIVGLLIIIIIGIVGFVYSSYDKNYNSEYPVTDLKVESDSAMIERGRYLALGPAHCIDCHAPMELVSELKGDDEPAMSGGFGLEIPPGTFYAPNITPDIETGIGNYSDGELYRMLRYNIRQDGQACINFMPFINMTDEDIYSIISYLRTQEAVKNKMLERELSFMGKMLFALGAIKPGVPDKPILKSIKEDTSAEYGRYLANAVANCMGCHTKRDLKSGEFIGEEYAGGMVFGPDTFTKGLIFVSPNLTPDENTGIMAYWDEDLFIARMKAGKAYQTTPMPWVAFQKISENDLKAIYRFLKTLKPLSNLVSKVATPPEEN